MFLKLVGWAGMLLNIFAYYITVNGDLRHGIPLAILGCVVYGLYAMKSKIWNLVVLQGVFFLANLSGLVHLLA